MTVSKSFLVTFWLKDFSFIFQRLKRYKCIEAINEAVAKKSYSTGKLSVSRTLVIALVLWYFAPYFLSLPWCIDEYW